MSLSTSSNSNNAPLDDLDLSILMLLQGDGRMSFTVMAEKLNVSISNIRMRVGKLIEDKTIQIVGRVNPEKVGFHAYAHVKIAVRPANMIESITDQLLHIPEVSFLATTSGDFDIVVDLMCRDNNHLVSVVNESIVSIEGVYQTKTDINFKILKYAQPNLGPLR